MIRAITVLLCLVLAGCTTTTSFGPNGEKLSETRAFEITQEHIIALESLHALALQTIDAVMELKDSMDTAEFEEELAERQAKADQLEANILILKELLAAIPPRE